MTNISHVKKYEQVNRVQFRPQIFYLPLLFLVLIIAICNNTYAKDKNSFKSSEKSSINDTDSKANGGRDLPLEISEKYYKKEAILKFNDAVKKWEEKNIPEAISLWEEAVKIDPTLWVAYVGLGQAYDAQKEYSMALKCYEEYLELAPKQAEDRKNVGENVEYLSHLLRFGEAVVKSDNYLDLVKTKHQGKEFHTRFDLNKPLKIYFYPALGVPNYRSEFKTAFLEGAMIWQEVLPELKFEVIKTSTLAILKEEDRDKVEKELIDKSQIKVIFPSRFKVKGDPSNPIAGEIDAQSFPIIRDKKNFRVLGVIMVSPYVYFQSQIAIPLEPLSKLENKKQIEKLKIIGAREIGHVLGIWGFSPNPDDLMFEGEVTELKLSTRDKNTMKKLYELDPDKGEVLTNL